MRIAVTGGAGYVGSLLVDRLLGRGWAVRVVDRRPPGPGAMEAADKSIEFALADVRDLGATRGALDDVDVVVHLAAVVGYPACAADPGEAWSTNVEGTRTVLRAAAGRPIVVASTMSCLGRVPSGMCDENARPRPTSLYGESKLEAERLTLAYGNAVVLRPATAFGPSPRMRHDLLVHQLLADAVARGRISIYEPSARRSFVHVRDIANAFAFAIEHFAEMRGKIYHVGSANLNITKHSLARAISEVTGCAVDETGVGKDDDSRDYWGDFGKLTRVGYRASLDLSSGISELVNYLDGASSCDRSMPGI